MAHKKTYTVPYRRKRQGKTNYKKRLFLLKSSLPRLVVRKSNRHILVQLVEYSDKGDRVMITVTSRQLLKYGWNLSTSNIPAAYLVGLILGKAAKGKKAVLDLGLQMPQAGSKIFAALKGAVDGGLDIAYSEKVLPPEERIIGSHIGEEVKELFEKTKKKILG